MAVTQYIGSRYVPLFADPAEWSPTKTYEPLTIVLYQGNSFTSKQFVPVGIDIANTDFWAETGNYNAQIEQYRRETAAAFDAAEDSLERAQEVDALVSRRLAGYYYVSDYTGSDDDAFDAALAASEAYAGMPTIVIDRPLHVRRSHVIRPQASNVAVGKRVISSRPMLYNVASRMNTMRDDCWDFIVEVDNISVLCVNTNPITGYALEPDSDAHFAIENIKIKNNGGMSDSTRYAYNLTNIYGVRYNTCSINIDGLLTIGLNGSVIAEKNKDAQTTGYMDFCMFNNVHMDYPQGCAFASYKNDNGCYSNMTVGYPNRDYHGYLMQFLGDSASFCSNLFIQQGSQAWAENTDAIIYVYGASMVFDSISMEHFASSRLFYLSQASVLLNTLRVKFNINTIAYLYASSTFILGSIIGSSIAEVSGSLFACRNDTSFAKLNSPCRLDYAGELSYLPFVGVGGGSIYDVYNSISYDLRLASGAVSLRVPGVGTTVTPFDTATFDDATNKITLSGFKPDALKDAKIVQAECVIRQGATPMYLDTRVVDNAIEILFPSAPSGTQYMWLDFKCYK